MSLPASSPEPGPMPSHGLRPLHVSEMRTFQRCPREWFMAYDLRRVPRDRPEALTIGSAVHRWMEHWWMGREAEMWLPESPVGRALCLGYAARYQAPHIHTLSVEEPFTAIVGGVDCAGTVDAICEDGEGRTVLVEHKTTSQDIGPGSVFWRQMQHSPQTAMYLSAFPKATILYDVLRKPTIRKLRAGKPTEETDDEFVSRCLQLMSEEPERYFARFELSQLDAEHDDVARDIVSVDRLRKGGEYPRNTDACLTFGRPCGYYEVCHGSAVLSDESMFMDSGR